MKRQILLLISGAISTALLLMIPFMPALADGEVELEGGPLVVVGKSISFAGFALDGHDHLNVAGTTELWTAEDARGVGTGWRMTISASDFMNGAHVIPATGFKVMLPQDHIVTIAGNTAPASQLLTATAIDTTQNLAIAAEDTGMGSYTLAPLFTLDVPAVTAPGTYTSLVTVDVVAAP